MINPQWLELPMSRITFYGPKGVRVIEVRLYINQHKDDLYFTKKSYLLERPSL